MATPTPQLPWARWAKVAWKAKDAVISGIGWLLFEDIREIQQAPTEEGGPTAQTWRLFRYRFDNTSSAETADDQYLDFEIVNQTNGEIDDTWTTQDHQDVVAHLDQLVTQVCTYTSSYLRCVGVQAYSRAFAPITPYTPGQYYKHFVDSGPPVWGKSLSINCTGGGTVPPQCCTTVTEEVPDRKHWGRAYLPTLGSTYVDANGKVARGAIDALLGQYASFYASLQDAQFHPVVVSTMANKVPSHALQNVTGLRIDDNVDIQRRRRYKHSSYIAQSPAAGATQLPALEE